MWFLTICIKFIFPKEHFINDENFNFYIEMLYLEVHSYYFVLFLDYYRGRKIVRQRVKFVLRASTF